MANRRVNVAELEFDQIKQNLKTFLQGQAQFQDFNFEGSNMSILLDLLAYNTHYNAMYMNMALNEAYLDSASRRDSVVSLAKSLGYTPRSYICANTTISFTVTGVNDAGITTLVADKNTPFYGTKDSIRYTFYTAGSRSATRSVDGSFTFTNVKVVEGAPVSTKFDYTEQNAFIIPNSNVDITTLVVRVQESPSTTLFETFVDASTVSSIESTTPVYFLRETDNGFFEISFGDNVVGKALTAGNVINVEYFVCSGEDPNGISALFYGGAQFAGGSVTSVTLSASVSGGRNPESIEEIRFNAPNYYQAQNRAVTARDYESIIRSKVPSIKAVSVWGGEDNDPPIYGKVFISARTVSGLPITIAEQQSITTDVLNKYKSVAVIPEFVTPEYIWVELDLVAYYNPNNTPKTSDTIRTNIVTSIKDYNANDLQRFNRIFRSSTVTRITEATDLSITSVVPRIKVYRTITPIYDKDNNYIINIGNPFVAGTIRTSNFYIKNNSSICYIVDDGSGKLNLYSTSPSGNTLLMTVGSVNYTAGSMTINSLNIVRDLDSGFRVSFTPDSADIVGVYNQIVAIDEVKLKVNLIVDDESQNGSYQFVSSRI